MSDAVTIGTMVDQLDAKWDNLKWSRDGSLDAEAASVALLRLNSLACDIVYRVAGELSSIEEALDALQPEVYQISTSLLAGGSSADPRKLQSRGSEILAQLSALEGHADWLTEVVRRGAEIAQSSYERLERLAVEEAGDAPDYDDSPGEIGPISGRANLAGDNIRLIPRKADALVSEASVISERIDKVRSNLKDAFA